MFNYQEVSYSILLLFSCIYLDLHMSICKNIEVNTYNEYMDCVIIFIRIPIRTFNILFSLFSFVLFFFSFNFFFFVFYFLFLFLCFCFVDFSHICFTVSHYKVTFFFLKNVHKYVYIYICVHYNI